MFHQVNDERKLFYKGLPVNVFEKICKFFSKHFDVIHVSEIQEHFNKSNRPAAIISFDDGHYDLICNALPILQKYNLKFNVNIDTEILETSMPQDFVRVYDILNATQIDTFSNERFIDKTIKIDRSNPVKVEKELTDLLSELTSQQKRDFTHEMNTTMGKDIKLSKMITVEDLKMLTKMNVEFGTHGHTHPILTKLSQKELEKELSNSMSIMKNITGKEIIILAYPNGIHNEQVEIAALNMGYKYLLKSDDMINKIKDSSEYVFNRINQYHQSFEESLANIFGFHKLFRKIIKRLKRHEN
jgi:peptidoglycan/xylan/chitin deacetylase (PgdA/CDA1 family)